jgi:hypothetical protein
MWLEETGSLTTQNYLKLSDLLDGEATFSFPRSVRTLEPAFRSMAAAGGHLYGLVSRARAYEVWKLR